MKTVLIAGVLVMALVNFAAVSRGDTRSYNPRLYWCSAAYAALLIAPMMPSLGRAVAAAAIIAFSTVILALRSTPFLSRRGPDGTRKVGHNDLHWPPRWPGHPVPRVNRYDKRARAATRKKGSEKRESAEGPE